MSFSPFGVLSRWFGPAPAPRAQAAWLVSLGGFQGPQSVAMDIYRLGEGLPRGPGTFLVAGRQNNRWQSLYVGETADLRSRVPGHEALPEALLLGATHVHILREGESLDRRAAADRLIFMYGPVLNAAAAPLLSELIQAPPTAPTQEPERQPRLAVANG
jgi:hypothetical protein